MHLNRGAEEPEPEAMERAKPEDENAHQPARLWSCAAPRPQARPLYYIHSGHPLKILSLRGPGSCYRWGMFRFVVLGLLCDCQLRRGYLTTPTRSR